MTSLRYRVVYQLYVMREIYIRYVATAHTHTTCTQQVVAHPCTHDNSGSGKTVMGFKKVLEQVLDCGENGQSI